MKKLTLVAFAVTVLMSLTAIAQEAANPDTSSAAPRAHVKAITLSGTVSDEGQTFISDKDVKWGVANPEALDGHDGGQVTIKCFAYPDKRQIHVLAVRTGQPEVRYTNNRSDSAFRR